MAHFIKVLNARRIKRKLARLIEEKGVGLARGEDESEDESREYFSPKFKRKFRKTWLEKFTIPNAVENVVWKSFLGFVGGVLLTYIFFFFFKVGVNFSLRTTTYMCGLLGIFLCLGLAYSSKVRCYVLLLIPVFFSKQGREALLTYALFLAFTGPAKNTMHNIGILSDSMACGQEIIKGTLRQISDMVKAPFRSIKETLKKITAAIKNVVNTVKEFVDKIKRIITSILNVIKKAASWLGSIINFCNKKVGTPFQRCMKTFDDAILDCKAKLGVMDFLCHVVHLVKALCYTVKWLDFICLFTDFVSDKVIGVVKKKLREFGLHVKALFYVSIEFSHSYEFKTVASKSTKEVAQSIVEKIGQKMEDIQRFISFFGFVFAFAFIFIFFKVYYYKYKFLTSDQYDNYYINKYVIELDLKRAKMDRETVLPLEPRERRKFAQVSSVRLVSAEKKRLTESLFLLNFTTLKVITFILVDYFLFWVLLTIYECGQGTVDDVEKSKVGVHVEGKGILANFYRSLGDTFKVPENPYMQINPLHCLPDPVQPDVDLYIRIGFLVGLCWFLTVTEAYGLRIRNIVMSHYYPDRAKERAIWLYNHILQTRSSFVTYVRRQLRRQFGNAGQPIESVSFKQRLFASHPLLRAIFQRKKENYCLICGAPESKVVPLKRCKTQGCPGRFCLNCYGSIQNICTICQNPIDYGDISDISEEVDSSDEDMYKRYAKQKRSDEETSNTFKDLEIRDNFRDLEANKKPDFARLGDLYSDKTILQDRIKQAVQKRIHNLEAAKYTASNQMGAKYKKTKSKVRKMIERLNRMKVQQPHKSKIFQKEDEEALLPKTKEDYEKLKKQVKAKIQALKHNTGEKPIYSPKLVHFSDESSEGEQDRNKKPKSSFAYYFVEKETDFFKPQSQRFDGHPQLYFRYQSPKNYRQDNLTI